jgi:hypothetical protein
LTDSSWTAAGYSRPTTSEASSHTPTTRPSGQSSRVNAPPTSSAAASPDRTVSTSKAKNCAFWSVKLTPLATPRVLYTSSNLSSW